MRTVGSKKGSMPGEGGSKSRKGKDISKGGDNPLIPPDNPLGMMLKFWSRHRYETEQGKSKSKGYSGGPVPTASSGRGTEEVKLPGREAGEKELNIPQQDRNLLNLSQEVISDGVNI